LYYNTGNVDSLNVCDSGWYIMPILCQLLSRYIWCTCHYGVALFPSSDWLS